MPRSAITHSRFGSSQLNSTMHHTHNCTHSQDFSLLAGLVTTQRPEWPLFQEVQFIIAFSIQEVLGRLLDNSHAGRCVICYPVLPIQKPWFEGVYFLLPLRPVGLAELFS